MKLLAFLAQGRRRALDRTPLASEWTNIYFSGTTLALWRAAAGPTRVHSKGLVLDAGSGRGGWREVIVRAGAVRESVDVVELPGETLTWTADLMHMPVVPSERYDTVVCHQVLEHVPRPWQAVAEMHRVLKPGGTIVVSVPHLSRLHELPNDYFRYTPGGLSSLLCQSNFEIITVDSYGGVLCFLHHQFSTLLLGMASVSRPVYSMCVALNAPVALSVAALDRLVERAGLLPNGVIAVARKPE